MFLIKLCYSDIDIYYLPCYYINRIAREAIKMTQIEVILLSLLCDKDYYGYEFESVIEQRNMRGWTNIGFSSIYNSLNKLEKNGHIFSRYEKEYGSPKRKVYSIKDETRVSVKEQIIKMML